MSDLRKLGTISWPDRWWLLQAGSWLGVMRVAVWLLPFRRIVSLLHLIPGEDGATEIETARAQTTIRIGWAISVAASHTPWLSTCLVQSLAGLIMLKRRRIPGALYLGVAKSVADPTKTDMHAWLRSGPIILTGASGHERFSIISTFTTSNHRGR